MISAFIDRPASAGVVSIWLALSATIWDRPALCSPATPSMMVNAITAIMGSQLRDLRDRSLILLGFAAALRRSELVALDFEDIEVARQGLVLNVRRGKTDQDARGRKVAVPLGRTSLCPVTAFEAWRLASGSTSGPVFTTIGGSEKLPLTRLSSESVSLVLRARLRRAGYDPTPYSGHSLRAGLATSAAANGVTAWKIRAQTGHSSDAMLARYIRDGELWVGNAASVLL